MMRLIIQFRDSDMAVTEGKRNFNAEQKRYFICADFNSTENSLNLGRKTFHNICLSKSYFMNII